jgi:hypothetical protein
LRKQNSTLNLEDSLQSEYNSIQKKVIDLLRPLAKKIPDMLINGALKVWYEKSLLGDPDEININKSYEKLI